MLIWQQPQANQVNFLPWLEHHLMAKRRQRLFLYGASILLLTLTLIALTYLHLQLLQVQATTQRQVIHGAQQIKLQQQRWWAKSEDQRRTQWQQDRHAQQAFYGWWSVQELAQLLTMLEPQQRLLSWHWQPSATGRQVIFAFSGRGQWQLWWQKALKVWPSLRLEALNPDAQGWKFEASYLLTSVASDWPVPTATLVPLRSSLALQLRPPPFATNKVASINAEAEALVSMTRQVAAYGKDIALERGQGVQLSMRLNPSQWPDLAPLPSAKGWHLQKFSILKIPSQQWQVAMQWLPSHENLPADALRSAPSLGLQATIYADIKQYAQAVKGQILAEKKLPPQVLSVSAEAAQTNSGSSRQQLIKDLKFIGFSQPQGQAASAWLKSLSNPHILRVKVGHQIKGWRVFSIKVLQMRLRRDQQLILLKRACTTGVCQYD